MNFCPACGHNIEADREVVSGPWTLRLGVARHMGDTLPLTTQQADILHTLAAAGGRPVASAVLRDRVVRYGREDNTNALAVQVCRIRAKLSGLCLPVPFHTVHGRGYVWSAA